MMDKPSELYQIQEPGAPAKRAILHLGIRPRSPAEARPVERPWPRQVVRRGYLRRTKRTEV